MSGYSKPQDYCHARESIVGDVSGDVQTDEEFAGELEDVKEQAENGALFGVEGGGQLRERIVDDIEDAIKKKIQNIE